MTNQALQATRQQQQAQKHSAATTIPTFTWLPYTTISAGTPVMQATRRFVFVTRTPTCQSL